MKQNNLLLICSRQAFYIKNDLSIIFFSGLFQRCPFTARLLLQLLPAPWTILKFAPNLSPPGDRDGKDITSSFKFIQGFLTDIEAVKQVRKEFEKSVQDLTQLFFSWRPICGKKDGGSSARDGSAQIPSKTFFPPSEEDEDLTKIPAVLPLSNHLNRWLATRCYDRRKVLTVKMTTYPHCWAVICSCPWRMAHLCLHCLRRMSKTHFPLTLTFLTHKAAAILEGTCFGKCWATMWRTVTCVCNSREKFRMLQKQWRKETFLPGWKGMMIEVFCTRLPRSFYSMWRKSPS